MLGQPFDRLHGLEKGQKGAQGVRDCHASREIESDRWRDIKGRRAVGRQGCSEVGLSEVGCAVARCLKTVP